MRREERENTEKFQQNTIPYRRQMLKEGETSNENHSFPPFPFLSFPPLLNILSLPFSFHKRFYCSHFFSLHYFLLIKQLFFPSSFFVNFIPFLTRVSAFLIFILHFRHKNIPSPQEQFSDLFQYIRQLRILRSENV